MIKHYHILFPALLWVGLQTAFAQSSISGTVTDEASEPLPGVSVMLAGTTKGTVTSAEGKYYISNVAQGYHTMELSFLGYEKVERKINVQGKNNLTYNFILKESVSELDEIVVSAKSEAQAMELSAKAVDVIETRQLKIQTVDMGEVLARTQGVNVQRSGGLGSNAQLSLNGLTNDQIRFFVDGVPLQSMGYSYGIANIPVNLIDRIEIYKGVVPIRFGADALGGAVNVVSNQSFEGTGGTVSYQTGSFGTHRVAANVYHQPAGSNFFAQASGFYDYARNNFEVDVEVPNARGRITEKTVERFHDEYLARGINLDLGLKNQKWADIFSIRGFFSAGERDLQHNFIMSVPYGEVTTASQTYGGLARWEKKWNNKFAAENIAGFSNNRTELLDTATLVYTWDGVPSRDLDGDIIIRDTPGELGQPSDVSFDDITYYNRLNLSYSINDRHEVRLSSAPTFSSRSGRNALITDPEAIDRLTLENELFNFVNGLEYEYKKEDALNIIAFFKNYTQGLSTEEIENGGILTDASRTTNNQGWGASLKYQLSKAWEVKASYEWATRLPNLGEVFGDGIFIFDNIGLNPERSHNINLAANLRTSLANRSELEMGVNAFVRDVKDLLVLLGTGDFFVFQNVADASSRGLEWNGSWISKERNFTVTANATYFDFVNTSDSGPFSSFEGDRIPNRPYLFFNNTFNYRINKFFSPQDDLSFFGGMRYVHEFFRSWESAGRRDTKQVIPSQFTQNVGITYSRRIADKQLTLTGEIQNLSDAQVFDLFGVQRPGRAFYIKTIFTF
jgi:outer membrane cobalamin receptor